MSTKPRATARPIASMRQVMHDAPIEKGEQLFLDMLHAFPVNTANRALPSMPAFFPADMMNDDSAVLGTPFRF
jgi:hypothetical protein